MADSRIKKRVSSQCTCLFEELVAGRDTALADIYDLVGRQMFVVAMNVVGDYQLAEDALQDGLLHIYRNASTLKDSNSALAWMLTIIRNSALDILRKRKNEFSTQDIILEADNVTSNENNNVIDFNTKMEVDQALNQLDEVDRQIVLMKSVMGYSHMEISRMLGITLMSCQKKYQRAIKRLNVYLR